MTTEAEEKRRSISARLQAAAKKGLDLLRAMLRSRSGTSAVEFSLILPAFATIVLGVSQVSDVVVGSEHMQAAVRASVQYALNGGDNMATAETVGLQAWQGKPADATLVASDYCTCDGYTTVCTQTCLDGDVPEVYIQATAKGHLGGSLYYTEKTLTETARIR